MLSRCSFAALVIGAPALALGESTPVPPPRPPEISRPSVPERTHGVEHPLPPERPASAAPSPALPSASNPPSQPRVASEQDLATCKLLLDGGSVVAQPLPPIHDGDVCGIDAPVALQAIVVEGGRRVRIEPAPRLRCDLAATLARWLSEDVMPGLSSRGLKLEAVITADAYSCRTRNHVEGAKLSEHAHGNAVDIDAFVFEGGRHVALTNAEAAPFVSDVRASACARFATILGPGSDAFHNNHIHLDLEDRRTHGTLCQWRLPGT